MYNSETSLKGPLLYVKHIWSFNTGGISKEVWYFRIDVKVISQRRVELF